MQSIIAISTHFSEFPSSNLLSLQLLVLKGRTQLRQALRVAVKYLFLKMRTLLPSSLFRRNSLWTGINYVTMCKQSQILSLQKLKECGTTIKCANIWSARLNWFRMSTLHYLNKVNVWIFKKKLICCGFCNTYLRVFGGMKVFWKSICAEFLL